MPDPSTLGLFMVTAMAILLIPGPTVLFVVTCSLNHGRRAGLVSVLGVETGSLIHVIAATAGLSALLVSSSLLFGVVKGLGAAYLMYLGIQTLLDGTTSPGRASFAPPTLRRVFWQGALIDALNPKTALFFLAFLPQFIRPASGAVAAQTLILGLIFLALAIVNDSMYALLAARLSACLNGNWAFAQRRKYLTGGIYLALGLGAATETYWHQPAHNLTYGAPLNDFPLSGSVVASCSL